MKRSLIQTLAALTVFCLFLTAGSLWAQVDVNHASRGELMRLSGVDSYAVERIMAERPFRNKSQLRSILGERLYDRIKDEIVARKSPTAPVLDGPVNINLASRSELLAVKGLGEKTAELILAYRPFWSVEELRDFINKSVHTKIRDQISVGNAHGLVDVNSAGRGELLAIVGLGPRSADAILRNRPFQNKVDLRAVLHGSVFARIRERVIVRPLDGSTSSYGSQGLYDTEALYDTESDGTSDPYGTTGSEEPSFDGTEIDPYGTTSAPAKAAVDDGYDTW